MNVLMCYLVNSGILLIVGMRYLVNAGIILNVLMCYLVNSGILLIVGMRYLVNAGIFLNPNQEKTIRIFATGKHHAVVNLFRDTINNVRKLSTSPVRRVTTASGKCKKLSTKIRKRQRGVSTLQRYSCWASHSLP